MPVPVPHADALRAIADTYGTPTYVYREAAIRDRCRVLRQHLDPLPLRLLYAMKANTAPAILRILKEEGFGLDAVSPAEMLLARRLGFTPQHILYSANNMTDADMHDAVEQGVVLNIGELSRLERFGQAFPGKSVCIRLNPQVGAGHHAHVITGGERAKFGIPVEQTDAVLSLAKRYDLKIIGLHQHIGSGILDTNVLWQAIQVLLDASEAFPNVQFLNFGGGLGIPYRPTETPLDFTNFEVSIVEPLLAYHNEAPHVEFWFEPGRFLVAESGTLLTRVNTVKANPTRTFAGTDSGMGHLVRPAMYNAYHPITNISNLSGPQKRYDVVGNICESADFFARDRMLAEIREGDLLAIHHTGAYGMAMAFEYNLRPLPAEVMICTDGTIAPLRKRLTPRELVDRVLHQDYVA